MNRPEAAEMLVDAGRAHRLARRRRQGFWVPLVVFGAITLLATPLYRYNLSATRYVSLPLGSLNWFAGSSILANPALVSLYWLIALPLGYVATVVYYRAHAHRTGVTSPLRAFVITGFALMALLVLSPPPNRGLPPADLVSRGLTPLLTVAVALLVLAWTERAASLAIFAVAFLSLTLVANLYNIENLFYRVGISVPAPAINVIIPGAALVLAGAAYGLAARRAP